MTLFLLKLEHINSWETHGVLRSICLGMVNICLAGRDRPPWHEAHGGTGPGQRGLQGVGRGD